jgi:hypothetical protein
MSSQIVEREIVGFIGELQEQGRHAEAAFLEMEIFEAKGWLPKLVAIRDHWADKLEGEQ